MSESSEILKSTSRRQGRKGNRPSERSPSANLCADEQKLNIRPNPWVSKHNIAKPDRRTWEMVNSAVVERKIMQLPGEICQSSGVKTKVYTSSETLPEMGRVKRQKSAEAENLTFEGKG